jgi:hypothetical protein
LQQRYRLRAKRKWINKIQMTKMKFSSKMQRREPKERMGMQKR